MKNRILAVLLSFITIFGMLPVQILAEHEQTQAEKVGIGFGCFSEEEYQYDKVLTRGEFAKVLAALCGMNLNTDKDEWTSSAYGSVNDSETVDIGNSENSFRDVDRSYPYYNEINAVYNAGYMSGISENLFAPEYDITLLEVVKVITDMLGYGQNAVNKGGYPSGYSKTASEIGLLLGISDGLRSVATEETVLKLFYNAMDIKILELDTSERLSYSQGDKTFMEGVLKTYKVKGVVTDNGITAISSESGISKDEIKVDGKVAFLPEKMDFYRGYIGKKVEMYYLHDEKEDTDTVRYIMISKNDQSITFSSEDFVSYENGLLTYEKGNRTVSKNIGQNSNLIYNNKFKSTYTANVFDFESGDITLCSTLGNGYDLIIINSYEYAYVTGINSSSSVIYNGIKSGSYSIDMSEKACPDFINIKDAQGNKRSFADISVGNVLEILRCDGGIEAVIFNEKITDFTVKSINGEDTGNTWGRKKISNGTDSYNVLKSCYSASNAVGPEMAGVYTLYLNGSGEVVWMEKSGDGGKLVGILTRVYYDEEEASEIIRQLTFYTENGELKRYSTGEKLRVDGKTDKFKNLQNLLKEEIGNPLLFETDSEGLVKAVTTPADYNEQNVKTRGWYRINPPGDEYYYGGNGDDFDRFFYNVRGKTKVFKTPETTDAEEYRQKYNFSIGLTSFSADELYKVEGFSTSADSVEADVIVYRKNTGRAGTVATREVFLIQSISKGLSADDEEVLQLDGYSIELYSSVMKGKSLLLDPEAIMIEGGVDEANDEVDATKEQIEVGPRTPSELQAGDMIRFSENSQGLVDSIRIAYDYDTGKCFNAGHGNKDRWFADGTTYAGDVISKYASGIRIATGKKPEAIDDSNFSEVRNNVKGLIIGNTPIVIVEKGSRGLDIRQGTMSDILTYNDSNVGGEYDRAVVVAHQTALVFGTVIYKR